VKVSGHLGHERSLSTPGLDADTRPCKKETGA